MRRTQLIGGILLFSLATVAQAHNCPVLMKDIDDRLQTEQLEPSQREEIMKLRVQGEKLHKEGKHVESMKTLNEAKAILNLPPANLEGTD